MAYDFANERREAIEAGERAKYSLERALDELNKARGWGIYDMLGGGMISSIIKHSKMNRASEYIHEAKFNLESFSRELGDIDMYANVDLSTGDFWGFADWFFDGLISDWVVQDRIVEASVQVRNAIHKVDEILRRI